MKNSGPVFSGEPGAVGAMVRGETPRHLPRGNRAVMKQPPRYPVRRLDRLLEWWLKWVIGGVVQVGWNLVFLIAWIFAVLLYGIRAA